MATRSLMVCGSRWSRQRFFAELKVALGLAGHLAAGSGTREGAADDTNRSLFVLACGGISACNPNARPPARAGAVGIPAVNRSATLNAVRLLARQGKAAYKAEKYKDAIRLFEKAERNDKTAAIAVWIGDTYAVQGGSRNWKHALEAYQTALGRDPRVLGARLGKAWYQLTSPKADIDAAIKLIQEERHFNPVARGRRGPQEGRADSGEGRAQHQRDREQVYAAQRAAEKAAPAGGEDQAPTTGLEGGSDSMPGHLVPAFLARPSAPSSRTPPQAASSWRR
ncbi:MAG: tetratricopeptide repeat protein [Myxococcota bacterium]